MSERMADLVCHNVQKMCWRLVFRCLSARKEIRAADPYSSSLRGNFAMRVGPKMQSFAEYIKKFRSIWLFLLVCNVILHGKMLLSMGIGVDTELLIGMEDGFYTASMNTGRQWYGYLAKLLNEGQYNPYFNGVLSLMLFVLAVILWTYLFYIITEKENVSGILGFGLMFSGAAIMTEQCYFRMQIAEELIGFCVLGLSLCFTFRWLAERSFIYLPAAVLSAVFCFGIYQAFVPLYILGAVIVVFLMIFFSDHLEKYQKPGLSAWILILKCILIFLLSYAVNQIITRVFFNQLGGYLTSQICWSRSSWKTCARAILTHMERVFKGSVTYYPKWLWVFVIYVTAASLVRIMRKKKALAAGIIATGMLLLSPFYLTILMGTSPVARAQYNLVIAAGFFIYVSFLLVSSSKKVGMYPILVLAAVLCCGTQIKNTSVLNYTDEIRSEQDITTGEQLIAQIDMLQDEDHSVPVYFVGSHSSKLNSSCRRGEVIGYSIFEWDAGGEPYCYNSTRRAINFLKTLGTVYKQAKSADALAVLEKHEDLSDWPEEGSIIKEDGIILVHFS